MATARSIISGGLRRELEAVPGCRTVFDEPLAGHTSMGTGGPADAFCRVENREALKALLYLLAAKRVAWIPIGQGTNLLPSDLGLRGAAVKLEGEFKRVQLEGTRLRAGAGTSLSALLDKSIRHELGGLEFAVGIPGSVGGALIGNAGAPEDSLGAHTEIVELFKSDGSAVRAGGSDLEFSYRSSNILALGDCVLAAEFVLDPRPRAASAGRMSEFAEKRKGQPVDWPNAGCIFRNPPGFSAGKLIDEAGLKGERCGGAEISKRHANFIINLGGATTADVTELIERARSAVATGSNIGLETEIVLVDETGRRMAPRGKERPC